MSSKKKFKVYYPEDHEDITLAGKPFKTSKKGRSVVMTSGGYFLVITRPSPYDTFVTPLCDYIEGGRFNIVWEDQVISEEFCENFHEAVTVASESIQSGRKPKFVKVV